MKVWKFKGLFLLMLVSAFLCLSTVNSSAAGELDLETAVDRALENSLDYQIATVDFEKSKLEHQKSIAGNLLQPSRYNELSMEISRISGENTYRNTGFQVIQNTIRQYGELWLSDLDLEIKEKNLELEKMRLEEARAQYEIGDIGSITLLERENSYKDTDFNLEMVRDDYQQKSRQFRAELGWDAELKFKGLSYENDWTVSEEEALETALNNSIDLLLSKKRLELAEIDLERASVSAAELDKKIKDKALESSRLEVKKRQDNLVNSIQQTYYQFKQAVKSLELAEERLRGAEERYRLREEQYQAGLITKIELLEFEVNMLQARYNYLSRITDYLLSEESLRQEMVIESGVLPDAFTENS